MRVFKIVFVMLLVCVALAARADICAICGQEIHGTVYMVTDKTTGQKVEVCSNCAQLPRCFICGLPVKDDGVQLPDGRWLCARDSKTAVLDPDQIQETFEDVHDALDRMYARYTAFPTNVYISVIDRVDVDSMFQMVGNSFESPNVLGVTQAGVVDGKKRYKIGLLGGQPMAQLREVCAHELSHAWVGENVSAERHAQIDRDAEEGFCEMMGYLLMDAEDQEGEKKRVLANSYTRGQVNLFVEAEQQYGIDEVMDWMQYGVGGRLEEGHLDEIRDVKMPGSNGSANYAAPSARTYASVPPPVLTTIQLQGIMWGGVPSAIINGKSFFPGDISRIHVGQADVLIRCVDVEKNSVRIKNLKTGEEQRLSLPKN